MQIGSCRLATECASEGRGLLVGSLPRVFLSCRLDAEVGLVLVMLLFLLKLLLLVLLPLLLLLSLVLLVFNSCPRISGWPGSLDPTQGSDHLAVLLA